MNENDVKIYLDSLVSSNTIIEYALTGINKNSFEAVIHRDNFGSVVSENILIYPYLNSFKYSKITNKQADEDTIESRVEKLEETIKNITLLQAENLPKTDTTSNYYYDKTNLTFNFWRTIIEDYPNLISQNISDGFKFLNADESTLSETDLRKKWDLENWMNKLIARNMIEVEVGDTLDQVADNSKRIAILERMLLRLWLHVLGEYTINEEIGYRYTAYAYPIIEAADMDIAVDRIDLEDEVGMITKLETSRQKIRDIIKEYYLDKIK